MTSNPSPMTPSDGELADLRKVVQRAKFTDEASLAEDLPARIRLDAVQRDRVEKRAVEFVQGARLKSAGMRALDAFLHEFGLSTLEGIALMCLAEALLRVPDDATADALIAEKIVKGNWSDHLGRSDSFFVNASAWGLLLTGKLIGGDEQHEKDPKVWLKSATSRLSEPVVRRAMTVAMRIMGGEFVLGRTIDEALKRGYREEGEDGLFSFDMLGEGARTFDMATQYRTSYLSAIRAIGEQKNGVDVYDRSGVSVKLSALHPRYEDAQRERVISELLPIVKDLALEAAQRSIGFTIDAEEADRLDLSMNILEKLARDPDLKNWQGLGLAVQAYSKRALPLLDWLAGLGAQTGRRFMVRLVKGAYWETEIKHAQELGLPDFSVFTRKCTTDVSYLACATFMLSRPDVFYGQFATHNAHTLAAILEMAEGQGGFEFQRLHGMGSLLYEVAREQCKNLPPVRIYAPVGSHKDLLAYLVRRLLENGANTSFVHGFLDESIPALEVVRDPLHALQNHASKRHPKILLPADLFSSERVNSLGVDLSDVEVTHEIEDAISASQKRRFEGGPIIDGDQIAGSATRIVNPACNDDVVGTYVPADESAIMQAFEVAKDSQTKWNALGGSARADVLDKIARLFKRDSLVLVSLLVREAGKTIPDAVSEIREAVDFCRYYAARARIDFGDAEILPGPTGELNSLSLHGRGVFVCISPWNFPLAIFSGQVVAALAAGNTVIAKPAEQTPLVAAYAVKLMLEAGVPPKVLHLAPGEGSIVGPWLLSNPNLAGVAFTGSTETAHIINRTLAARSGAIIPLIAETGGQNVMFVDSTALLEQVTDDVVQSAFLSAGQRCSALRVLYLQEEIADDAIAMIKGAMITLSVGNPCQISTDIGPVIDPAARETLQRHIGDLEQVGCCVHKVGLEQACDSGSFLAPHVIEIDNLNVLTREHFGPVLHVVRYRSSDLDMHIEAVKESGFGLTLGIHSRIDSRAADIYEKSRVGNTYVNRNMVGAVVGVQPFGGQGLSGTGPKAGGPHYLHRFATERVLTINTMASGGNADLLTLENS